MNKLYVMVGAPGSGKTTFAKKYLPDAKYISRDEIRFSLINKDEDYFSREDEVYREFIWKIYNELQNNHNDVIADATHLNEKSRAKLFKSLPLNFSKIEVIGIYLHTPLKTCLARNAQRSKDNRTYVPESALSKMFYRIKPPNFIEFNGIFNEIWDVYTNTDEPDIKVYKGAL